VAFVLDASVVLSQALEEGNTIADHAMDKAKSESALAPALWWYEVRNGLVINERRGRLTEPQSAIVLRELSQLTIILDRSPSERTTIDLARRYRLTVYDAAYLELALREGLPLATLDATLAAAAVSEGVRVLA
jgi:predicted nucleic acid-binding protein